MTTTSWHLINGLLPALNAMKTEPNFHNDTQRGSKTNPANLDPINFNALILEQEIQDTIDIHCRFHGTAQTLHELLAANYPTGQSIPITTAWNNLGSDFLELIQLLIQGHSAYTQRMLHRLKENEDDKHLNLYQLTQALTVLGYQAKYDTIKKWAKRGHLSHNGTGYSLEDALQRITLTQLPAPS